LRTRALVETEQIERVAPFHRIERAVRPPTLAREELHLDRIQTDTGRLAGVGVANRLVRDRTRATEIQRPDAVTHFGVGLRNEPIARLHQMAVGVVEDASLRIRHSLTPYALKRHQSGTRREP
jgi:hypothetical protein